MLRKIAPVGLVALALITGCSSNGSETRTESKQVIHALVERDYKSVAELERDSTLQVRVTAGASKVRKLNDVPFTITDVKVNEVLGGKMSAKTLSVQQLGSHQVESPGTSQLLAKGQDYLLFLEPYHLVPGDNTGLYIITGDQGIYSHSSKSGKYEFAGVSHSSVPKTLGSKDIASIRQTP